jgi:hypothetical protein
MANKVVDKNEIFLNGVYYPLMRPIQSTLASIYPAKVVIGDTTRDSQTRASVVSWSDWRGGIGVERMQGSSDMDRAWWSTLNLRHRHHLVLPALATATDAKLLDDTAISGDITFLAELGTIMYAGYGLAPHYYRLGMQRWTRVTSGGSNYSFPSTPSDAITVQLGGTNYVVVAHVRGYSYFSSATTVTDKTTDAKYLAFWDDRLWGIDEAGQLWYILTIGGTPENDAKLPLPSGHVNDLFVGRDSSGELILYAATKTGLYAHDSFNSRWVETEFKLPFHRYNGTGSVRWRDSIYTPSGLGLYKYINGSNNAVITVMGPDRDDGVPEGQRGTIKMLAGSHTELLAALDGTTAPEEAATYFRYQQGATSGRSSREVVFATSTGTSSIVAWNDVGWQVKWVADTVGRAVEHMMVTNAGEGDYRLWWGFNGQVYHQMIPFDITNPAQLVNMEYATSGYHETPWFDAQQVEVDKVALKLKVEVNNASSNETVVVQYATDYSDSYTSMGTITSSVVSPTVYPFKDGDGNPVGLNFRAIKFKLTLAREAGTTTAIKKKSPDVVSVTLEYRKKLEAKYGHTVEVNLNKPYKGKTSMQLRESLVSAIESNTLVEFTFRDDSGGDRNYYVDVTSATGIEYAAYDERGASRITLVEP